MDNYYMLIFSIVFAVAVWLFSKYLAKRLEHRDSPVVTIQGRYSISESKPNYTTGLFRADGYKIISVDHKWIVGECGGFGDAARLAKYPELLILNAELLDMLETIENDNGAIPSWLWKRIQVTISKAGGNAKPVNAKKDGAYE